MKKFYSILATILMISAVKANVITGNFSICLPGPNTTQLFASVAPAPITATTPWVSSNPAVATINSSGLVTAISYGATTITYTDNLGFQYSENVYVSTFPTISAPNGTSTCQDGTLQLEGSLFPNAITPWESLNTSIATIDNTGLVTGISAGVVNILYRNLGGCTTTIPITIKPLLAPVISCGLTTPNSVTFNWSPVLGALTYVVYYTINGGPFNSAGSANTLTYTSNALSPGDKVNIYVAPAGAVGSCYQVGTTSCFSDLCPTAGSNGTATICEASATPIDLFSLIEGEDAGGVWVRNSGSGGDFNASLGIFTPTIGTTTSAFTYTFSGSSSCPSDASTVTINVIHQPNAGIAGSTVICESSSTTIDLFALISGEQPGGTWARALGTGGIFDSQNGTFTPTIGAATSSFIYTVFGENPCSNDTSIATVNINHQPIAGFDGCISVQDSNPTAIDLYSLITGEEPLGVWTRTSGFGGTFNAASGTFIPSIGATTSTFTYSITGAVPCVDDTSVATVIINGPPIGQAVDLFCDGANSTANSIAFDWNNVGQTSFNFSYTINGGPTVSGTTTISNYQVLNVPQDSSVTFTVQPVGGNCFPSSTTTCNLLSNSVFESELDAFYPNPFHDILNLKFAEPVKNIQITNILGQHVFRNDFNEKEFQINLAHLTSGTYFVTAYTDNTIKTFKIIKN